MSRGEKSRAPLEYDADEVSKGARMPLNGALEDLCLTGRERRPQIAADLYAVLNVTHPV